MNLSVTLFCFFALVLLVSAVPTHKRNSQGGPYGGPGSPYDGPGGPNGGPGGPNDGLDGPYGYPGGPPPSGPGGSGMQGMGYAMSLIAKGCGPNAKKVENAIRGVFESNILGSELFSAVFPDGVDEVYASIPEPMITMGSCAISNIESLDDVAGLTGGVPVERIQPSYRLMVFLERVFASGLQNYVDNMGSEEQELADGLRSLLNVYYVAEELGLYDLEILDDGEDGAY